MSKKLVPEFFLRLKHTVKPQINGHSKRRTLLISGQFHFPGLFPCQILIKKDTQLADPLISGQIFSHEMDKTPILALQLADEYQTGHKRQKSKNNVLRFFISGTY